MKTKFWAFILGVMFLGWVSSSLAATITDLFFNLGISYDNTDSDALTSQFSLFDLEDYHYITFNTTDRSNIGVGTTFSEEGHAIVQELQDINQVGITDDENMVHQPAAISDKTPIGSWELTFTWSGLTGSVYYSYVDPFSGFTNIYIQYDPGARLYLFLDTTPDANEMGTSSDPTDDTGFDADTNTVQILEAELKSGYGGISYNPALPDLTTTKWSMFTLKVISVIDNTTTPYLDSVSYDLNELVGKELLFSAITSSSPGGQLYWNIDNNLVTLKGQGEGTFQLHAPEPATLLLVGSGLFLIGFIARKKGVQA